MRWSSVLACPLVSAAFVALAATPPSGPTLVSGNAAGTGPGNAPSRSPSISADGRFVAFQSDATDLVAGDADGQRDVFLRDLKTGKTTLVAVNGTASGPAYPFHPSISSSGRFVVFKSVAADLAADDGNGTGDVFLRDMKKGTTTLVSVNAAGAGTANGESGFPSVSADGRIVAFQSVAFDLVADDANGQSDVFVRDVKKGTTALASIDRDGTGAGNGSSDEASLSANGRFVAFASSATNLVSTATTGQGDVFVRDLKKRTTTLVSVKPGATGAGTGSSYSPSISANGRFVAFESHAIDLVAGDANGLQDIFVRDLKTGTTTMVSVNVSGTGGGNADSGSPCISADGRYVAFASQSTNLVAETTGAIDNLFVRDLKTKTTRLVSVNAAGTAGGNAPSGSPSVSRNGRVIAFDSLATDLVAGDANAQFDVFVRAMR